VDLAIRPRLLDLFCGAGGAAMGYDRAGFDVVGVDNRPQPNYPFEFVQADALDVLGQWCDDRQPVQVADRGDDRVSDLVGGAGVGVGRFDIQVDEDLTGHDAPPVGVTAGSSIAGIWCQGFDAIHASPPCQAFSDLRHRTQGDYPDLIAATRDLLQATGLPYVIENVEGAPLENPTVICGSSLGLGAGGRQLRRHRLFETNFPLLVAPCVHQGQAVGVYGTGGGGQMTRGFKARGVAEAREALGTPWMTLAECAQAIPPAYTELIGHQLLAHI
jgi:DNA (cytosine-5)-methyltransferase 1